MACQTFFYIIDVCQKLILLVMFLIYSILRHSCYFFKQFFINSDNRLYCQQLLLRIEMKTRIFEYEMYKNLKSDMQIHQGKLYSVERHNEPTKLLRMKIYCRLCGVSEFFYINYTFYFIIIFLSSNVSYI